MLALLCVLQAVPAGFGPVSPAAGPKPAAAAAEDSTRPAASNVSYSCPSPPSGYLYKSRNGTTCHYSKTLTTTSPASSRTVYSCPSTYRTYRLSSRSGSTCRYSKTLTTTSSASSRTVYSCPSTYRTYRLSSRSGSTCRYSKTLTTTSSASGRTTYSCPSTYRTYRYTDLAPRPVPDRHQPEHNMAHRPDHPCHTVASFKGCRFKGYDRLRSMEG